MNAKLEGVRAMKAAIAREKKAHERALGGALYQEGVAIISESQKIVPHEYGPLENSAYVAPPEKRLGRIQVEIGYGKAYALRQHEELTWRHRDGRQAKYLEKPFNAASQGWASRLAKRVRALKKSGGGFGVSPIAKGPDADSGSSEKKR